MDKNEIDKMFDAFNCVNLEVLLQLAGMDVTDDNVSKLKHEEETIKLVFQRLMNRIENGDIEYFFSKVQNNNLDMYVELLKNSTDKSTPNRLQILIENNREKIANMDSNIYGIVDLIILTKNSNYIKSIIDSKERRDEFDLTKREILGLIKATKDSDYIKSIIESKEKRDELGITIGQIYELMLKTKNPDYIKIFLEIIKNEEKTIEYNGNVVLQEGMTIGIEIESEGKNSEILRKLEGAIEKGWEHKGDGSLSNGIEIVSPILTGDNEKTSNSIKNVCTYLNKLRTDCIRKMWGTYSYRCRLFNYTKELDEFNRNMGKCRKNIIYNKQ